MGDTMEIFSSSMQSNPPPPQSPISLGLTLTYFLSSSVLPLPGVLSQALYSLPTVEKLGAF